MAKVVSAPVLPIPMVHVGHPPVVVVPTPIGTMAVVLAAQAALIMAAAELLAGLPAPVRAVPITLRAVGDRTTGLIGGAVLVGPQVHPQVHLPILPAAPAGQVVPALQDPTG